MNRYGADRLEEVGRFLKLTISKEEELQEVVELAAEICNCPIAMITMADANTVFVKVNTGRIPVTEVNYNDTFCQYTFKIDDLLVIPDAKADERMIGNPYVEGPEGYRFYAGMPLKTHHGNAIGTLCVIDRVPKTITDVQALMLRSLSQQATRLLEFEIALDIFRNQYKESSEAANTLATYFQSSTSCHMLLDRNKAAIAFNQSMADLIFANHGIRIEEGMTIKDLIHPEMVTEFNAAFNSALAGKVVFTEKTLKYHLGEISWNLSFEPAVDEMGDIIGVSFTATDISESVNNQSRISAQIEALGKIEEMQANQLRALVQQIESLAGEVDQFPELARLTEIELLKLSVDELLDKMKKVKT